METTILYWGYIGEFPKIRGTFMGGPNNNASGAILAVKRSSPVFCWCTRNHCFVLGLDSENVLCPKVVGLFF